MQVPSRDSRLLTGGPGLPPLPLIHRECGACYCLIRLSDDIVGMMKCHWKTSGARYHLAYPPCAAEIMRGCCNQRWLVLRISEPLPTPSGCLTPAFIMTHGHKERVHRTDEGSMNGRWAKGPLDLIHHHCTFPCIRNVRRLIGNG